MTAFARLPLFIAARCTGWWLSVSLTARRGNTRRERGDGQWRPLRHLRHRGDRAQLDRSDAGHALVAVAGAIACVSITTTDASNPRPPRWPSADLSQHCLPPFLP